MQLKLTSDQVPPPDQRDAGAPRIDLHAVTAADETELVRLARAFHQEDGHPLTGRGEQALQLVARGHPQARAWLIREAVLPHGRELGQPFALMLGVKRAVNPALRLAGDTHKVGIYGFGAAAHIVAQVLKHQGRPFYAFTRPGDTESQHFARQLGASWVGDASQMPPEHLDAALIFAPAGPLVPAALRHLEKGGCVVCAGIHMSDIPAFPYADLWGERSIRSVANLTRQDGLDFLALAPKVPVHTSVTAFRLEEANEALERLRRGELQGAAVLGMG